MPRRQGPPNAHAHDLHASLGDNTPNPFERGTTTGATHLPSSLLD
jgi:hypothetical protein